MTASHIHRRLPLIVPARSAPVAVKYDDGRDSVAALLSTIFDVSAALAG
jgi:hypothetical protein